jgi:hypothetical protein
MTPPPNAVIRPQKSTPKRSNRLMMLTTAPDTAKAQVPMISNVKIKESIHTSRNAIDYSRSDILPQGGFMMYCVCFLRYLFSAVIIFRLKNKSQNGKL